MNINLADPFQLIPAMLATHPAAVVALPVFVPSDPASTLIITSKKRRQPISPDLARRIAKEQAHGNGSAGHLAADLPTHIDVGRMLLTVPSDVAEAFRGPVAGRHVAYLILVHREAYDSVLRQAETGIVLAGPQDMPPRAVRSGIIKP